MLPVCSATPCCSSHSQISFHGGLRPFSPSRKAFEVRCIVEDRIVLGFSNGTHLEGVSFKAQATKSLYSSLIESNEQSGSMDFINLHSCPKLFDELECRFSNRWNSSNGALGRTYPIGRGGLKYVESSSVSTGGGKLMDFKDILTANTNIVSESADLETVSTTDVISDNLTSVSDSLDLDDDLLTSLKTNIEDFFYGFNESIRTSVNKGENVVKSSIDTITSSIKSAIENAVTEVFSTADRTGELASNRLTIFSSGLKEATSNVGVVTVDVLRRTIVAVEDSLSNGATFVVYSYGSAKDLLPPEIRNVLNLSEERAIEILRPVGTALQQVYIAVEGLEKSLGLDPNDPIVPFVLFLGTSATLWVFYWTLTYGGYSGDLSPKSTLELLAGKENVVLIDVRPEDLRERDGIPDLRRAARFRYASVTLPEFDGSVRKLLKSGKELDDSLIAAVIRNLKIVQDRSKVIVMDADGSCSKGIARSLRKLGVKVPSSVMVLAWTLALDEVNSSDIYSIIQKQKERPYLVQGGFRSWVKQGLRAKELKPETALTILSEEAEAILEDIRPTPVKILGFGVGFIAAFYALQEWEKTLQFIAIVGLGQTIYRRVSSYKDAEGFKQDVRLLLAPVRLGAQAFSWAAGKLETNRIGLPTSPSSSDVQNRVLQAAAKHESQPSDSEEIQDLSPESTASVSEKVDLSEA